MTSMINGDRLNSLAICTSDLVARTASECCTLFWGAVSKWMT